MKVIFLRKMLKSTISSSRSLLKCTLHSRRIQKNSITVAMLVEFLVVSIFHETKISTVYMKVQVSSNFSKNKIEIK
jgi:hypothetical protein